MFFFFISYSQGKADKFVKNVLSLGLTQIVYFIKEGQT